jgi:amino acid transporter
MEVDPSPPNRPTALGAREDIPSSPSRLERHFGLFQATALNVTMIVGAGVFITIPLMLQVLPGPYALLGWLGAGALILVDGLIWSELGAAMPGSGGSYLYLLECYGRERWGRLMAFLFIWQFLISGPLEVASGLIAISQFSNALSPAFARFNDEWTMKRVLGSWGGDELIVSVSPSGIGCLLLGAGLIALLYRRITVLGKLTVTFWLGVMGIIGWILVDGALRFDRHVAFDMPESAPDLKTGLGAAMILAIYSYLGYYNVCYIGDEVREPARTIPRAVLLSALLVCLLFTGLHLAMLGTVPWQLAADSKNLPADFMRQIHGDRAATLVGVLLIWSCLGSVFAALLGYSRIPYGAARYGHFFAPLAGVHPVHHIPHVSLLLVGGLTLFWSFFDLGSVINALITTRILEQFVGQVVGVVLWRRREPNAPRPYKMWLYPLPCALALVGWLYLYVSAGPLFIVLGLATLACGLVAFLIWSRRAGGWPY